MPVNHPPSDDGSWHHQLGTSLFPASPSRYHLYIGAFCPYGHRADLARSLKGLQPFLPVSSTPDHLYHSEFLSQLYFRSDPDYKGKYTVPMLWDKETEQVVNNESQDMMRMLSSAFNDLLPADNTKQRELDFCPPDLRPQIDELSSWMSPDLATSVYKASHAPTSSAYAEAAKTVFTALERFEHHLAQHPDYVYLLSPTRITEADLKLYTTLIRFNPAFHPQFDDGMGKVAEKAPRVGRWLRHLFWKVEGVRETTDLRAMR
ncbi:MAG: hypothetical protein Q9228_003777 [Teloschistes exilis]